MQLPTRWIKVVRDMWGNKTRSALVVVSIAVGVFAVGMTTNAGIIIRRDMNAPYVATHPASTTLYLTPFDENLARAVAQRPEISEAEARRLEDAEVYVGEGEWMDLGLTAAPDFEAIHINQFTLEAGERVPERMEILLERMTAEALGVSVGDTVTVRLQGEDQTYDLEVAGVVHDMHQYPLVFFEQGAGYVDIRTLWWMGAGAHYNALPIIVAENPTYKQHILDVVSTLRDDVIERAGHRLTAIQPFRGNPGEHYFASDLSAVLLVLMVMGVMCIFLGAGLVINTISALIARQVQQIGIIRSVGGLRRHITLMYLSSVLTYSVAALLIAIPLGLVGAKALAASVGGVLNFDVSRANLPLSVALLQVGVGLLVPFGAAFVPVMSGTRISVYDAIYQQGSLTRANSSPVEAALKKIKGLSSPVALAVRNTFRRKGRLTLTLGTLTLAGATFMAAFSTHLTLRERIAGMGRYWLADVEVALPGGANARRVEREALSLPDVDIAEGWYSTRAQVELPEGGESEGIEVMALPTDTATIEPLMVAGRWLEADDTNAIVVNEEALDRLPGLRVGDEIALRVSGTDFQLKRRQMKHLYVVVGVVSRHLTGPRIYAPYAYFTRANDAQEQVNLVRVRASAYGLQDQAYQEDLAARLVTQFDEAGMGRGSSETQYRAVESNSGNFDILLSILLLMAGLLALVGGLGLAGTMSLNVMERNREIGVLRAVGASNAAVRRVVLFEGVFVGLISWLLSALLSVPFSHALANAVSVAMLQTRVEVLVSTTGMALWLALVLVIAVLATLAAAQRASQLTVREVLAYE